MNSILYESWASCEGEWTKSTFYQNVKLRHVSKVRGRRRWLTAKEMDERFGPELAEQIRNRKLLDPELKEKEVRRHPELPDSQAGSQSSGSFSNLSLHLAPLVLSTYVGMQEMMQFLTLVEEDQETEVEESIDRLFNCIDESSSESSSSTSKSKKKKKKDKKAKNKKNKVGQVLKPRIIEPMPALGDLESINGWSYTYFTDALPHSVSYFTKNSCLLTYRPRTRARKIRRKTRHSQSPKTKRRRVKIRMRKKGSRILIVCSTLFNIWSHRLSLMPVQRLSGLWT